MVQAFAGAGPQRNATSMKGPKEDLPNQLLFRATQCVSAGCSWLISTSEMAPICADVLYIVIFSDCMTANTPNHADHWSTSITSSKDFLPFFPTIHQTDGGPQQSSLRLALLLSAMQSAFQWLFSCADARPGKGRSGAWVCAIQDYNTVVNQPSKSVSEFTSFKWLHEIFLNPESRSRDPVDYVYLYKYSKL